MKLLIINTLSIFILSYLGIGIHVTGFVPALLVAIVFAILNIVGLVTFLIAMILYLVLLFITFLINKFFGPDRYGPYDIPPVSYKGPRYKR